MVHLKQEGAASEPDLQWLLSARAVREKAEQLYDWVRAGYSEHFDVNEAALTSVVECVEAVTKHAYPDLAAIPYHSRLRHFDVGGVNRWRVFEQRLTSLEASARLRASMDLVICSVLLDAGAGDAWRYFDPSSASEFGRSEGLAVASFNWFIAGGLSSDPVGSPLRADAARLAQISEEELSRAFAVSANNPLLGVPGRVLLLRRLADSTAHAVPLRAGTDAEAARPGALADVLVAGARAGKVRATEVLRLVLLSLGNIWPGRESFAGVPLGDVWTHSRLGRVPFHKLSQWLSYSLCECLERAGYEVTGLDELTGLAEYRNGGLFIDLGVIVPKGNHVLTSAHAVSSDLVIEWRALTVRLLDLTAARLRDRWGLSEAELPLARVLEGGTWAAGRRVAAERRVGGGPPLQIISDGTVF